jgi:hypothetical protein
VSGESVAITSSGAQQVGPVSAGATAGTYQATITATANAGSATITGTDSSIAPAASASATLTQTSATTSGSTANRPSNEFTIDGYTHNANGTITLTIDVPGPGSVGMLGTHSDPIDGANTASAQLQPGPHRLVWTRKNTTASKAGKMRIELRPGAAGVRMLRYARAHGWALHVRVWTTFTPTGGRARSRKTTIRVLAAATARPSRTN